MAVAFEEDEFEVVVIGNGPSGICLSYMLSGNWPYYVPHQHPDPILDEKLCKDSGKSVLEMDLEYVSEGLHGRSLNPVALLFDQLQRPNVDLGSDQRSCLKWHHHSNKAIKHVVLGSGPPGGSWHYMQGSQLTLSLNNWLELPGYEFQNWLREHRSATVRKPCNLVTNGVTSDGYSYDRATTSHIAEYYKDYIHKTDIAQNFWYDTNVLSVKSLHSNNNESRHCGGPCYMPSGNQSKSECWEVRGVRKRAPGRLEPFVIHADNIVLATGCNTPKTLGIPGEHFPFVYHKLSDVDALLSGGGQEDCYSCLVVGAGLSAGDAIVALKERGIPVVHVFRRSANDAKVIFNQLPAVVYPEYYRIKRLMRGEVGSDGSYTSFPKHKLVEICKNRECILENSDGSRFKQKVLYVFVLIGGSPDLTFIPGGESLGSNPLIPVDCKQNPVDVNPFTYESTKQQGMFCLGPLVGDNFVRFGTGGTLAVASHFAAENTETLLD